MLTRKSFLQQAGVVLLGTAMPIDLSAGSSKQVQKGKRVGIIGLDTSHSIVFTDLLNASSDFLGYKVVAAYPYGSKEIKSSAERIPAAIKLMESKGVKLVDSIDALLKETDVILLETNDGRLHLEQALQVIEAGKRMFIDKPIAASYKDAAAIFRSAEKKKVPVFSSSALRFATGISAIRSGIHGKVLGAATYSPCYLESSHPDLYWYGIHGVEMLYAIMGTGCKQVTRIHTPETDLVTGCWENDRLGSFRGMRSGKAAFGATVFTEKGVVQIGDFEGYHSLLKEIVLFFETGKTPVPPAETLEICWFMDQAMLTS